MTATCSRGCSAPEPGARGAAQPGAALALVGIRQRVDVTARVALGDGRRGRRQHRLPGPLHRDGPDVGDHRVALVRPEPHPGAVQRREGCGDRPVGRLGGPEPGVQVPLGPGGTPELDVAGVVLPRCELGSSARRRRDPRPTGPAPRRTHRPWRAPRGPTAAQRLPASPAGPASRTAVQSRRRGPHATAVWGRPRLPGPRAGRPSAKRAGAFARSGAETRSQGSRSPICDATRAGRRIHGSHFSELPGNAPPVVAERLQWALS